MKTPNTQQQAKILLLEALAFFNAIADSRFKHRHSDKVMHAIERAEKRVMRRSRLHSACFAAPSPDTAVLENEVIETSQGTTYSDCQHEYDRRDICVFCGHDLEDFYSKETVQGSTNYLCSFCIVDGHENVNIDVQGSLYDKCLGCVNASSRASITFDKDSSVSVIYVGSKRCRNLVKVYDKSKPVLGFRFETERAGD